MGAREKPQPIEGLPVDKVYERKLAELIGTTPKALERKRQRGVLPHGVWEKVDGSIPTSLAIRHGTQQTPTEKSSSKRT